MRGYFGIGIEHSKREVNLGTLWRSAHVFGASFIFTIGRRYSSQSSDTTKAYKNIPYYNYLTFDEFLKNRPYNCNLIGVEFPHEKARDLTKTIHPERAIYLLGAEDHGLTKTALEVCQQIVYIPSSYCLNVAVAGSIVMYDRLSKQRKV